MSWLNLRCGSVEKLMVKLAKHSDEMKLRLYFSRYFSEDYNSNIRNINFFLL